MLPQPYQYKDGLESARLRTRFLQNEDAGVWAAFLNDPVATEYFMPFEQETPEAKAAFWIGRQQERYRTQQYGLQALIDKNSGQFIGQCGFLSQEVDGETELEIGYHILPAYWGHGYAPEAARLFMDYAKNELKTGSVISIIDIRNQKSMRVAEKNGLQREKQTRWREMDVYIYRFVF